MNETNAAPFAGPDIPTQPAATTMNRYLCHDGTDAGSTFKAGLEITGICIVGIAVILTLYYIALKVLAGRFKPPPPTETADDE